MTSDLTTPPPPPTGPWTDAQIDAAASVLFDEQAPDPQGIARAVLDAVARVPVDTTNKESTMTTWTDEQIDAAYESLSAAFMRCHGIGAPTRAEVREALEAAVARVSVRRHVEDWDPDFGALDDWMDGVVPVAPPPVPVVTEGSDE